MELQDKVVLITGASKGLGRELARLFARRGARLALVARGAEALQALAGELPGSLAIAADVSLDAEGIAERALARFGRVDVLINNASTLGTSPMPALERLGWEELQDVLRVNVTAPLHLAQLVLPGMRERGEGVIVNVTSDAAVEAYPGWGAYGTSKAALEHLTRILAAELEGSGVRVHLVDPGDMDTELHRLAEPGVDLSHLPGPAVPAPFFLDLVEREDLRDVRYRALHGALR